jgi:hypothetical protein
MSDGKGVVILIEVSCFQEDPKPALESLRVKPSAELCSIVALFLKLPEGMTLLPETQKAWERIPIEQKTIIYRELSDSNLPPSALLLVHVNPLHSWDHGTALRRIIEIARDSAARRDHCTLSPCVNLFEAQDWFCTPLLLVLAFIDAVRWIWHATKFPLPSDMRTQQVAQLIGGKAYIRPVPTWRWICCTRIGTWDGQKDLFIEPRSVLRYTLSSISQHPRLGFALVWPIAFAFYYFLCAIPWWNPLVATRASVNFNPTSLFLMGTRDALLAIWARILHQPWAFTTFWFVAHAIHLGLVAIVVSRSHRMGVVNFILALLLYPVALTLFPLVYVVGRFPWRIAPRKNRVDLNVS